VVTLDGVAGAAFAGVGARVRGRVSVVGELQRWDGRRHAMRQLGASGVWEIFVPGVRRRARSTSSRSWTPRGRLKVNTDPVRRGPSSCRRRRAADRCGTSRQAFRGPTAPGWSGGRETRIRCGRRWASPAAPRLRWREEIGGRRRSDYREIGRAADRLSADHRFHRMWS
jgi:hypothetical protein